MKVRFNKHEAELWVGAEGKDLLSPLEQSRVDAGELALWEEHDGWVGLGGALRNNGSYTLLDAKAARLRLLPSVDRILAHQALAGHEHDRLVDTSRILLAELRERILNGEKIVPQLESIIQSIQISLKTTPAVEPEAIALTWLNPKVVILADPFHSLSDALRHISSDGVLALPRQHLAESCEQRVEEYIRRAGWQALPLGTINRCKYADFQIAVDAGASAIAFLMPDDYSMEGFVTIAEPKQLARLAMEKDIPFLFYRGKADTSIA